MRNVLVLSYLEIPNEEWNIKIEETEDCPRCWMTTVDLEITLSDGYILKRPSGTVWDGASIPRYLWWLFKPIDEGAMGDFIHDMLWKDKQSQFEYFKYNIFEARRFADYERHRWRTHLARSKSFKNFITHKVIRLIGGLFYSRQIKIPV